MAACSLLLVLLAVAAIVGAAEGGTKMFCYYGSDSQYRSAAGGAYRFFPENIDPTLCTHVIFAFIQPTPDGLGVRSVNWNDLGPNGLYSRTVALKKKSPGLRVLLAIGGWVIGSDPFLPVIASTTSIITFSRAVVAFLRQHGMDGMDMDWEFPGVRGSTPEDKPKFTLLLKTLQDEFKNEAARTGQEKLILTLATAAGSYFIEEGYESEEIVKYPDYLLLMTYNYHGSWENVTGHPSSVWSSHLDTGFRTELNMQWTVDYWLSKGAPRERIILGLATYGMTFTLADPGQHGILAPAIEGGGRKARYTQERGIMAYFEVCENIARYGWSEEWLDDQKSPYAYSGDQWVGYDNTRSLTIKVNTLINGYGLGGAFVWSVEMDDYKGLCGQGPYPLIHAIASAMQGGVTPPTTPSLPTTRPRPNYGTTVDASGLAGPVGSDCAVLKRSGIFKDWSHCGQFFYCVRAVDGTFYQYTMRCPPFTKFNQQHVVCDSDFTCI